MFHRVALQALAACIFVQSFIASPLDPSIALQEDSTRILVELHLGHPRPDLQVRRTLAAMLDLQWCVRERCESLLQLWAPTLAEESTTVYLDSTKISQRSQATSAVANWVIPRLTSPWALDKTADFRVIALISVYNESMARLTQAKTSIPLDASSEDSHHYRPKFQRAFDLRQNSARLWLAASLIIVGQAMEYPLTIQCSECESSQSENEQIEGSLTKIATDFLRGVNVDEREIEKASVQVVNIILDSRRGHLRKRADFVHRLKFWQQQQARCTYDPSDGPFSGLHLVVGAGPAEMGSESRFDPQVWVFSDFSTFDVTDSADWGLLLQYTECPQDTPVSGNHIHELFAEHVFEHLDYAGAYFALTQVAKVFAAHSVSLLDAPSFRIAVPDAWAGGKSGVANSSSVNSFAADVRDGHRARYTAWSLCVLLDAAGLDGMLLEWSYPQSASELTSIFPISPAEILEHSGWTSRVHLLDKSEDDRPVRRSVNGGDVRGAVSLVVDAYLPGAHSKNMQGDSCSRLLSAVAQAKEPGVWGYPEFDGYGSRSVEDGLTPGNLDTAGKEGYESNFGTEYNRTCIDSEAAMRCPECITWSALAAVAASSSSAAKTLSKLAARDWVDADGDASLQNDAYSYQGQAENMNLQLAELLQSLGQKALAIRAAQSALIYGIGPLQKRVLSNLAHILDHRQSAQTPYIVASPRAWQVFRPEDSIEIAVNLQTFDEVHREAIPYKRQASSIFNKFSRATLGTCFTLHKVELDREAESYSSVRSCMYLGGQSSSKPESPIVALTGLDQGQYELRVRLWWLPASIAASHMQRVPFCIESADPADQTCVKDWADAASKGDYDAEQRPVHEDLTKFPIYFITIVLNGMPFLHHHANAFAEAARRLGVQWEWHVVEGVARGRADKLNPYSSRPLGEKVRNDGCSTDGTFEYLNDLQGDNKFKNNVVVHRNYLGDDHSITKELFRRSKTSTEKAEARCIWMDKLEMVNTATMTISQPGVLFQIDVDELWSPEAIVSAYRSIENEKYQCLRVHCHFFVAPNLVTVSRQGYGHSDAYEWTRVWKFEPGATFVSHAPPILISRNSDVGIWELRGAGEPLPENVSQIEIQGVPGALSIVAVPCLGPEATAQRGIAFSHYAYALREQVEFKANFYGHTDTSPNATVESWLAMQHAPRPLRAADYLPWVNATERFRETYVDVVSNSPIARNVPVVPMPAIDVDKQLRHTVNSSVSPPSRRLVVLLDMVIFQRFPGGIARVWCGVLPHLIREVTSSALDKPMFVLLFRDGTPPSVARAIEADLVRGGISVVWREDGTTPTRCDCGSISCCAHNEQEHTAHLVQITWGPPHDTDNRERDQLALAAICRNVGARVFISTEYSTTIPAPLAPALLGSPPKQVLLVHDFTPERFGWQSTEWDAKSEALVSAAAIVAVSNATAAALPKYYPNLPAAASVEVSPNGLDDGFRSCGRGFSVPSPPSMTGSNESDNGAADRRRFGLLPGVPYIMVVGPREGYKNIATLYRALTIVNDVKPCVPWNNTSPNQGVQVLLVGGGNFPRGEEANFIRELLEDIDGTCRDLSGRSVPTQDDSFINDGITSKEGKDLRNVKCLKGHCHFVRAVFHAPNLDDNELREAYRGAALLAYLSLDEGFGLPIAESLACGCPVIVSDIAAHRELLRCSSTSQHMTDHGAREKEEAGLNCNAWRESSYGSNHPGVGLVDPTSPGDVASALLAFLNVPGGRGTYPEEVPTSAVGSALPPNDSRQDFSDSPVDTHQEEIEARYEVRRQLTTFAHKHFTSWQPLGSTLAKAIMRVAVTE